MTMSYVREITGKQREALEAVAEQAETVAEAIHQQRVPGIFSARPDVALQNIEAQLAAVARAIQTYLGLANAVARVSRVRSRVRSM